MCKFCTQNNSKHWDEIKKLTTITWSIKLMYVGVVEHTCHNAVMFCEMRMWKLMTEQSECYIFSCYTFPLLNIQLFSVICIETVLRFNCYDLRALCLYCVVVLIVNVGINWDFYVEVCEFVFLIFDVSCLLSILSLIGISNKSADYRSWNS